MKPTAYFVWNRTGQNTLSFYKPTDLQTEVTELYSADTVKKALEECRQKTLEEAADAMQNDPDKYNNPIWSLRRMAKGE